MGKKAEPDLYRSKAGTWGGSVIPRTAGSDGTHTHHDRAPASS